MMSALRSHMFFAVCQILELKTQSMDVSQSHATYNKYTINNDGHPKVGKFLLGLSTILINDDSTRTALHRPNWIVHFDYMNDL